MSKLLDETLNLLKQCHFSLLHLQLNNKLEVNNELSYKVRDQILKIRRYNNIMEESIKKIDKLFASTKRLDRLRTSFMKLSEKHQESEKGGLTLAVDYFKKAVESFLEDFKMEYDPVQAEEVLKDIIESKLAGMIHDKFKKCVNNETDKFHDTLENILLEKLKQDAFLKRIKEATTTITMEESLSERPKAFMPENDPKLKLQEEANEVGNTLDMDDILNDTLDTPSPKPTKKTKKKKT